MENMVYKQLGEYIIGYWALNSELDAGIPQ